MGKIGLITNAQVVTLQGPDDGVEDRSFCKHESTVMAGSDMDIYVHCYHLDGSSSDITIPVVSWVAAAQPARIGYVMTRGPSGSQYTYNFTGGTTVLSNPSTGFYSVQFNGMTGVTGTSAQVTASGTSANRCQIENWSIGASTTVNIVCVTPNGSYANTDFNLIYTMGGMPHDGAGGALWSGDTSPGTHTPPAAYSFNSTGGTNQVLNDVDSLPTFPGLDLAPHGGAAGVTQLSSYGSLGEFCNERIGFGAIEIHCFNSSGGLIYGRFTSARLWY